MSRRRDDVFPTVRTEGALLPPDLILRVVEGDGDLKGLTPRAYHLAGGERLNEGVSRSWSRLQGAWESFRSGADTLPDSDTGTTHTRERWLLILFQELGYGRLQTTRALEIEGKAYPVSHLWDRTPIHLVSFRIDLDRKTAGVAGAARMSPHGMVQELLNRSEEHLWGIVSNGLRLRILRDNASLTRQAYVEFDLEGMMEGEVYADFVLLWLLCHQSRFEVRDGRPERCWLERWARTAREQGTRALDRLREGVQDAIEALGAGFLAHPRNGALRDALRSGELSTQDYYREVLRLVYRLLFLFVAEDRELLLDPGADRETRERYLGHYSTARLRRLARAQRGSKHPDLYRSLRLVMEKLGDDEGYPALGLPALGSFLWSGEALPFLGDADIQNRAFLEALRALSLTRDEGVTRRVDYKNLGAEELGSVYESLLELHPTVDAGAGVFSLSVGGGHERRTTGSYYTPTSLVNELLDSALDPVLEEAVRAEEPERAILALKVCDPAVGSGHFLIAAAHRIARRLAFVRTGDEESSPEATRKALRDVIGHCLYGVDVNPMAVELCKVSLWMEALEPGKPLSFLDHRILCGNSLLGAMPALLAQGIPDNAFKPIEGDEKEVARGLKKQNRDERKGEQRTFFHALVAEATRTYGDLGDRLERLDALEDASIEGVHRKEQVFRRVTESAEYRRARLVADARCAAFVWPKREGAPEPVTFDLFRRFQEDPGSVPEETLAEVERLADEYRFFHWHLAYPDVFRVPEDDEPKNGDTGWSGGFDVVLGNPPWERLKLQEKEWFATRAPEIADARNAAARRKKIKALQTEDPTLYQDFLAARRRSEGASHLVRDSGRYPLCGRGDINTYSIFAETNRALIGPRGRVGCIVPSGIATDHTTRFFFQDLVQSKSLVSLYDFENRKKIFPAIDSRIKFCLLTLTGSGRPAPEAEFCFFALQVDDLRDPDRLFTLSAEEIELLNPNTKTCPIFRSRKDAELTKAIYRRVPVLIREGPPEENPWGVSLSRMFDMTNDSSLFREREQLEAEGWQLDGNVFRKEGERPWLPVYEGKMISMFDHRAAHIVINPDARTRPQKPLPAGDEDHEDPAFVVRPYLWAPEAEVGQRIPDEWSRDWFLVFKRVTASTNWRMVVGTVIPKSAVSYTLYTTSSTVENSRLVACLGAGLFSFAFDYCARQKTSQPSLPIGVAHECPMPPPGRLAGASWLNEQPLSDWIAPRVLELSYCSHELRSFAKDLGYGGAPFLWDEERRFLLRCELDAALFHLYLGTLENWQADRSSELRERFWAPRDAVEHILDTFPIVRKKDEKAYGEYRTKRVILEVYDRMAEAVRSGQPYRTLLDPPPADPSVAHPDRAEPEPEPVVVSLPTERRFRRVQPEYEERYERAVPLYTLSAAAGGFSNEQVPERDDWVEVPTARALRPGMFVARVVGRSMEPMIPDRAYCLFRRPVLHFHDGMILLAQHRDIVDPDTGGSFTVKRYRRVAVSGEDGGRQLGALLEPLNPDYPTIEIPSDSGEDFRPVAEFLEVVNEEGPEPRGSQSHSVH